MSEVIQLHNAWTIYRFNPDGSEAETGFAEVGRPQDWGNTKKWLYIAYKLTVTYPDDATYENNVHCWAEKPLEVWQHTAMFAPLICQILMPSTDVELCSNTHLAEDDFWEDEWGEIPPHHYEEQEDW